MDYREFKKEILEKGKRTRKEYEKRDLAFEVGKIIVEARIWKDLTQETLAELVRTQQPSIARVESGNKLPSLRFLEKIAIALGTYLVPPKFGFMESPEYIAKTEASNSLETRTTDQKSSYITDRIELSRTHQILVKV